MSIITAVGIDLAKNVFQICALNQAERVVFNKKVSRSNLLKEIVKLPKCKIFMEACGSSHFWAEQCRKLGHEVGMIAGQHVKKFVVGDKSDKIDAHAIVICGLRPSTRLVPIKNPTQLREQAKHRIRTRLVRDRTALLNEMRSFLYEHGIVFPKTKAVFLRELLLLIHSDKIDPGLKMMMADLHCEYLELNERIEKYEAQIKTSFSDCSLRKKIEKIHGVGPLTATAILSEHGSHNTFKNGRHFAAFLGLVPRHSGSGGKNSNFGISKRGDAYIRTLLIHGARSALRHTHKREDRLALWCEGLKQRVGANKAAVALANKNARIIWKLLNSEDSYEPDKEPIKEVKKAA